MGQKYLIDTNVIIDSLGNKLPTQTKNFLIEIDLIISAVSKIEILGWHGIDQNDVVSLNDFLKIVTVINIDETIVNKTIFIRQRKKIKLGDAIIAATALVYNLTLITHNISDFKNINGLNIIDPYNLLA